MCAASAIHRARVPKLTSCGAVRRAGAAVRGSRLHGDRHREGAPAARQGGARACQRLGRRQLPQAHPRGPRQRDAQAGLRVPDAERERAVRGNLVRAAGARVQGPRAHPRPASHRAHVPPAPLHLCCRPRCCGARLHARGDARGRLRDRAADLRTLRRGGRLPRGASLPRPLRPGPAHALGPLPRHCSGRVDPALLGGAAGRRSAARRPRRASRSGRRAGDHAQELPGPAVDARPAGGGGRARGRGGDD
eukprot:3385020-Rhodomonas_salina.1